ncbi:MAG TPA: sigma-54 dependent transcriptional regulator [Polyangiaceae bacterium]|nr:sigma-54 dependent transcriptional regulator [Polyangiaceae bacterium]
MEDHPGVRFAMAGALRRAGLEVIEADSCATAALGVQARPDVVIADFCLPDGDALELLPLVRTVDPSIPVYVVTGHGTIDLAVRAVKRGAEDFLTKPVDLQTIGTLVRSAAEKRHARSSGTRLRPALPFVPRSPAMQRVEEQVEKVRDRDCTVLLLGETGTGKSVLARRIHEIGASGDGPFVDINCAGLSRDFVESELFGHERGAFTGAHTAKVGLFDAANGGTLFLDEIGDVDVTVQPKLLKVLEEKRFRRMGDVRERSVELRLLAATHIDLLAAVGQKLFRADLYYRVSTVTIRLPPLRARREDIVPLASYMLTKLAAGTEAVLSPDAKEALLEHSWPGNLREMKNVLERAMVLRADPMIRARDLRFDGARYGSVAPPSLALAQHPQRTLSEMEREHIRAALSAEHGRVEAAARRLGIPRSTLYQRIKAYGLEPSKLRKGTPSSVPPSSR